MVGAIAGLCQLHRAARQAAVDNRRWRTAAHLLPNADPAARPEFGGSCDKLAAIGSHQKALMGLEGGQPAPGPRTAGAQAQPKAAPSGEQAEGEAGGERSAQKAKGKKKDK